MEKTVNTKIHIKRHKRKNSRWIFSFREAIYLVFLFSLLYFEIFKNGGYVDEVVGLISFGYVMFTFRRFNKYDIITVVFLIIASFVGFVSNFMSDLSIPIKSIFIDFIAESKLVWGFMAFKYMLPDKEKQHLIDLLTPLAKLWVISSSFMGIVSQVANTGMTGDERYGLKTFNFVCDYNFQYTSICLLAIGIIICSSTMSERTKRRFVFIAVFSILIGLKSPSLMFTAIYIALSINYKHQRSLNPIIIFIGAVLIIVLGWYQIQTYLVEEDTPRRLFWKYGVITANDYFPFGSGYSTFGSGEAAKNYSQLYYRYGFENKFGMMPTDTAFLSDTFWPMSIGQFGWIGTGIYLVVYIRLMLLARNLNYEYRKKAFLFASFAQFIIHAIGSAILSSSAGCIAFVSLALFTGTTNLDAKITMPKIRIKI